jgi:hypothetical protein
MGHVVSVTENGVGGDRALLTSPLEEGVFRPWFIIHDLVVYCMMIVSVLRCFVSIQGRCRDGGQWAEVDSMVKHFVAYPRSTKMYGRETTHDGVERLLLLVTCPGSNPAVCTMHRVGYGNGNRT